MESGLTSGLLPRCLLAAVLSSTDATFKEKRRGLTEIETGLAWSSDAPADVGAEINRGAHGGEEARGRLDVLNIRITRARRQRKTRRRQSQPHAQCSPGARATGATIQP